MNGPLLLALLIIILIVLLVSRAQSAPPGSAWGWDAIRRGFGEQNSPWPRSSDYFREHLPKSWPIRNVLIRANDELNAMQQTLVSAKAVRLPDDIIRSYDDNMRQAGRLLSRNSDRIVQAARTGPVSPQLEEALNRKQQSLQHLLEALQTARGSLAAVIVTGLEDQRDLDRVTHSLQAWSEALSEVSLDSGGQLPSSVHEA